MTYLVAQVLVRVGWHHELLRSLVVNTRDSTPKLVLGLMSLTFVMSTFVPNLITVIALIPVIQLLLANLDVPDRDHNNISTVLILGVMYAANIGGMGSLVGSPANGLLIAALHQSNIAEVSFLTFGNWLLFGFPMALVLLVVAWFVIVGMNRATMAISMSKLELPSADSSQHSCGGRDRMHGLFAAVLGVSGCAVAALIDTPVANNNHQGATPNTLDLWLAGATVLYGMVLMLWRLPQTGERLLRIQDLISGVPTKGVAFAILAGVCGLTLEYAGAFAALSEQAQTIAGKISPQIALISLVTITIFATELVSNTVAALAIWFAAVAITPPEHSPFLMMLGIAFASTSAFMSPLATPATGMAFGGVSGVSLGTMLRCGLVMNLVAALWITFGVQYWVPWILGI